MKKKELLQKLNNLKQEIKPDKAWQEANRGILLTQIKAQSRLEFEAKNKVFFNVFSNKFAKHGIRLAASFAVVILLVFGAWITSVNATKNSLTGEFWYSIKLTTERVQVSLALDDEKKANLEIEFAERRLEEIERVVEKSDLVQTREDIEVPLKKFQESIANIKSNLAKLEKTDSQTALKLANLVDEKTKNMWIF